MSPSARWPERSPGPGWRYAPRAHRRRSSLRPSWPSRQFYYGIEGGPPSRVGRFTWAYGKEKRPTRPLECDRAPRGPGAPTDAHLPRAVDACVSRPRIPALSRSRATTVARRLPVAPAQRTSMPKLSPSTGQIVRRSGRVGPRAAPMFSVIGFAAVFLTIRRRVTAATSRRSAVGAASGSQLVLASSARRVARRGSITVWVRVSMLASGRALLPITSRRVPRSARVAPHALPDVEVDAHGGATGGVERVHERVPAVVVERVRPAAVRARHARDRNTAHRLVRLVRVHDGPRQQPAGAQVVRAHRVVVEVARRVLDQVHRAAVRRDRVEAEVAPQRNVAPHRQPAGVHHRERRPHAREALPRADQDQLAAVRGQAARRPVVGDRRDRERAPQPALAQRPAVARVLDQPRAVAAGPRDVGHVPVGQRQRVGVDAHRRQPVGRGRGRQEREQQEHQQGNEEHVSSTPRARRLGPWP